MENNAIGYYEQIHFKCSDLLLYYNFKVVSNEIAKYHDCPHIDKLRCSRASELAPGRCITERKCELFALKDKLFFDVGIHGEMLKRLDKVMREGSSLTSEIKNGLFDP